VLQAFQKFAPASRAAFITMKASSWGVALPGRRRLVMPKPMWPISFPATVKGIVYAIN